MHLLALRRCGIHWEPGLCEIGPIVRNVQQTARLRSPQRIYSVSSFRAFYSTSTLACVLYLDYEY